MKNPSKIARHSAIGQAIAAAVAEAVNAAKELQRLRAGEFTRPPRTATCAACGASWTNLPGITAGARFDAHHLCDDDALNEF